MTKTIKKSWAFLVVFGLALCVFASASFGLELPPQQAKTSTLKIMTLEDSSFTVHERKFTVDAQTDIRDRLNRRITLDQMWIPCKADVEYVVLRGMEYLCLKIKVREELDKDLVNTEITEASPR